MKLKEYAHKQKQSGQVERIRDVWDRLAEQLEVHESLIRLWAYDQKPMPPKYAIPIERFTGGRVPRYEHCPEIYPREEYAA